jgi:GT2 family glycosyltransferase
MIAPKLLNTDKSRQQSVWRFPKVSDVFYETHYMNFALGKKNYRDKDFNKSFEADCFSGAAILFRKELLSKVGNLDETMFWIEDVELCYRAAKAGLMRVYFPKAEIIHHIGASAKKNYTISILNQVVNKIKFFKKHGTKWQHLMVVWVSIYHLKLKLLVFGLLSPFKAIYRLKAKAYWFTLFKVFNPPKGIS